MLYHNWFLTVFEKNIIPVVWISLCISAGLTAATYLVDPIYSIRTELILDASLGHVLPDMQGGLPATNSGDYIRAEFFAIDSINLMQQPEIGEKVIVENELTDGSGNKIDVADFINPSIMNLLFSSDGQGVTVKWISDTQQFSITGYGKNIHSAALLSSQYTETFIDYDKKQFTNILTNLKERREIVLNTAGKKFLVITQEQAALRKKHGVADWTERIEDVTAALAAVDDRISSEKIDVATSAQSLKEYEKQIRELKKPIHLSTTEKKSETLSSLQDSLTGLVTQLAAASVEFTPKHPEYQKVQRQIDVVRQQITNETKREYLESTQTTSSALDSIITNILQIRVNQAIRTIKLNAFNALKEQYLNELNFLGDGYASYRNLTEQKTRLNDIIQTATQDIMTIEALIEKPFSFFRVTSEAFVDMNNINNAKYLPQRKWTLLLSFTGVFLICIFYVLIRELHIETLFSAWQLEELSQELESIDIINNKSKKNISNSARHIFNFQEDKGGIIRIRRLDRKSDPRYIAKLAADYFVHAGESTLLVNNRKQVLWSRECSQGRGLHSWLTGHVDEATVEIQQSSKGYDVLYDEFWNPKEPWVKTMPEIRDFFATLSTNYDKVILLDPSVHTGRLLPGDALAPDIDILTVKGGALSVKQSLATIQREQQTLQANRTVILVMNNKESINPFSINGCFRLLGRFLSFPFGIFNRKQV